MTLLRRLAWLFRRRTREAELAEELALHEAMKRAALEARGLTPAEARDAGRREMGNTTVMREEARAVWIWPWLESVGQDVAYALRSLRRNPGFALVAVLTLASAIGLNTSLFTAFNALVLRRWDVSDAARMVNVFSPWCCRREGGAPNGMSIAEVRFFSEHARTMSGFFLSRMNGEGDQPGEPRTAWVSGNYFRLLGVDMALGRGFAADEDSVAAPRAVAVLSDAYWRTQLAGDPSIIGRRIRLESMPFTVIGVTLPAFSGTEAQRADAWIPLASVQLLRPEDNWVRRVLLQPEHCCTAAAGRLAPGATMEAAEVELSALRRRFQPPGADADQQRVVLSDFTPVGSARPRKNAPELPPFLLMVSGVVAVLLLACANVGNLLLARSAARQREIAVRMGLGASRRRVVRQLLTESLVLATMAGALGVAVAAWLPRLIARQARPFGVALHLTPDMRVLAFTFGLSALCCILFGLAPALQATRPPATAAVRIPLRTAFLSVQVALCVVLLVGAGLLVRGLQQIGRRDLGFAMRDLTAVALIAPPRALDGPTTRAFVLSLERVVDGLGAPGRIALSQHTPLRNTTHAQYRLPGAEDDRLAESEGISRGFFAAVGIPLLAGRDLDETDAAGGGIVINEALAVESGGLAGAVGRALIVDSVPRTVVGVVRDARIIDVDGIYPTVFHPLGDQALPVMLIRRDTPGLVDRAVANVGRLDRRIRTDVTPVAEDLARRTSGTRFAAALAGGLGALALLLASIGMFGVFSYWVQQRTQEIGVRMALGARPAQVIRLVFGASARAIIAGLAIGTGVAMAASGVLRSMLYGLSPLDPVAFAAALGLLAVTGIAAVHGPARRATRIDPMTALRAE